MRLHLRADQLATPATADALHDTAAERVRQVAKWGVQTRPDGTGESFAMWRDACQAETDRRMADGSVTWFHILLEEIAEAACETDPADLREELVQVAAVALSWVEDLDRKAAAK